MSTSNLSHTAPLAAVPTRLPLLAWVSIPLRGVKTFLTHALDTQEPSEQLYQQVSLHDTPLRFSGKSVYTPLRNWNGYR